MGDIFETTAYHKSSYSNALESVKSQTYHVCNKLNAWLGDGIYFWERKKDAERWDGRYSYPTITSASLCCDYDYFLNLDTMDGMNEFKEFVQFCQKEFTLSSYDLSLTKEHDYWVSPIFCQYYKTVYKTLLMKYSFPKVSVKPQYCADGSVVSKIKLAATVGDFGNWKWL